MAVNEQLGLVYAPISDVPAGPFPGTPEPGLNALDMATGELRWSTPNADNCNGREACRTGMSAAITATEELVFAAALDGNLYAYNASSGEILWSYDSWREFDSVNGLPTRGGAIDVQGPIVAGVELMRAPVTRKPREPCTERPRRRASTILRHRSAEVNRAARVPMVLRPATSPSWWEVMTRPISGHYPYLRR